MIYETPEPVEIPRKSNGQIDRKALKEWWSHQVLPNGFELGSAIGCYVFSISSGRGTMPWYVGKASGQVFQEECFEHHKLTHYNDVLASRERGKPCLTLFVKLTPKGRLAKSSDREGAHKDIVFLENHLIGLCIKRNSELRNVRDTAFLRSMEVPGLLNTPRGGRGGRSSGVQALKKLLYKD